METLLTLSIGGLPPLSARGCEQILKPIQLGQMQRTVNGDLVHLGPQILKYQSTIKAKDRTVLALNGLYPGVLVEVGCIQPLWEKIENTSKSYKTMRPFIDGSVVVMDEQQEYLTFSIKDNEIFIEEKTKNKNVFVCYRPKLRMRVTDFIIRTNEWNFESSWELNLEEI